MATFTLESSRVEFSKAMECWLIKQRRTGWVVISKKEIWYKCLSTITKGCKRDTIKLSKLYMRKRRTGLTTR